MSEKIFELRSLTTFLYAGFISNHQSLETDWNYQTSGNADAASGLASSQRAMDSSFSHVIILKNGLWANLSGAQNHCHQLLHTAQPALNQVSTGSSGGPTNDQGDITGGLQASTGSEPHASIASPSQAHAPGGSGQSGAFSAQTTQIEGTLNWTHSPPHASLPPDHNGVMSSAAATHPSAAFLEHNVVEVKNGFWPALATHGGGGGSPPPPAGGIEGGVGGAAAAAGHAGHAPPPPGWLPPVLAASAVAAATTVAFALTARMRTPVEQHLAQGDRDDSSIQRRRTERAFPPRP
jgi:hypothetical protein